MAQATALEFLSNGRSRFRLPRWPEPPRGGRCPGSPRAGLLDANVAYVGSESLKEAPDAVPPKVKITWGGGAKYPLPDLEQIAERRLETGGILDRVADHRAVIRPDVAGAICVLQKL